MDEENPRKRAVLYARVSADDRGRDGHNLASQLEMGREYAEARGWQVVGELSKDDRVASGAVFELPELQRILALAEQGVIDVVVTREIDRLSRTLVKQLVVESRLRELGVVIEYVLGDYPDTPEGQLNKLIRAVIAEYERAKISERMLRGKYLKVKAGSVMHHSGGAPYGYSVQAKGHLSEMVIDEEEAEVVRQIFRWYAQDGLALRAIAKRLTEKRILSHADKRATVKKLKPAGHWGFKSVGHILKNETYAGIWRDGA